MTKRLLAVVLCMSLTLSAGMLPAACATGNVTIPAEVQAEFDRLISIGAGDILDQFLMSQTEEIRQALMAAEEEKYNVPTVSQEIPENGTCGQGLSWDLTADGTLTIRGEGQMDFYTQDRPAPWYGGREIIRQVVLEEGVTSVGQRAFIDCTALETVIFPETLERIDEEGFRNCTALQTIQLPGSVMSIGWYAFAGCTALTWIQMPGTVEYLGGFAFAGCTKLNTAAIPGSVKDLGWAPSGAALLLWMWH